VLSFYIYFQYNMKNRCVLKRAVLISGIVIVLLTSAGFVALRDKEFDILKNLDIYYTLFQELNMFYVDETNPEKLVRESIDGMLESLDPYTQYIPESEMDDFRFQTTGEYGGIGALIRKTDDCVMIADPYENSPAAKNGIKAGDILVEIDGKSTKTREISDVSDLLKGEPGTTVELLVKKPNENKPVKKYVVREKITIPNVPYSGMITKDIGYIRLANFTTGAGKEVKDALIDLKDKRGAKSVILDIRGNPGGLLIEAVNIAGLFVDKGQEVVATRGKVKQFDFTYSNLNVPVDLDMPIILLVNRMSASASEIVAGSLQDLDRAVIIGQRTFGKGLVQTTRRLSYNSSLKVTTAKYYIPSGRCIQALDYSHRNEDGSVGYVPDSLISAFKTKHGRVVYDGGGIVPDLTIEPELLSKIAVSLYTKYFIFDYATEYATKHDSLPQFMKFTFTDQDYSDFLKFIKGKNFDYQTESELKLNELVNVAKREKYYNLANPEFAALQEKLAHDKENDLQVFNPEIRELIAEEIVGRYAYQKGRIQYTLQSDVQLRKAIEIMDNPTLFQSILNGTYKPDEKTARAYYHDEVE
jgi:carboxyl-terminal processing protease